MSAQEWAGSRNARPGDEPPAALVQTELDRILASELFTRSARLSSFLSFIVNRTLAGQGDSLKEQVIAVELYGKSPDFSTADDPIVRIDARRLRDRLREYYSGARDAAVLISVPKGSYTPVFRATPAGLAQASAFPSAIGGTATDTTAVATPIPGSSAWAVPRTSRGWWMAAAVMVLIAALLWRARSRNDDGAETARLLTVTSLPGAEEDPSLSPDGRFVAFSWGGPSPDGYHDIWVKSVDGDAMRNLTNTPEATEKWPRWSPDGQWIAFSRMRQSGPTLLKVSALGGPEQTIAESGGEATWTPDGRALVMTSNTREHSALVYHMLETGTRTQLTDAPVGFAEVHPRVSPDGRTLAFQRSDGERSAVFVVPMSGGEPAILGEWSIGIIGGLEWMPNGREILVARPAASGRRLMRVTVSGRGPGVPIPGIPYESIAPSVARVGTGQRYRLAIVSGQQDVGLRLVDLAALRHGGAIRADSPFCDATRIDAPGRFSPEGSRVAFTSDRSGGQQIWLANRDGSALRTLTQLREAGVSLGSWSPDGRWLAFDATIGDRTAIYVVPVNGGPAKRLTDGTANESDAEWSSDGQWIYFASNRSGRSTIWKMSAAGGAPLQLTSEVGFDPRESPDGRSIYFIDQPRLGLGRVTKLKRVAVEGGPAEVLDIPVRPGAWAVIDTGVMFVAGGAGVIDGTRNPNVLQLYDFKEHGIRTIGELEFVVGPYGSSRYLTVSRDGRWALVSHVDRWDRDVFVVDGFR
jgi:Tol biopolymer transport system component